MLWLLISLAGLGAALANVRASLRGIHAVRAAEWALSAAAWGDLAIQLPVALWLAASSAAALMATTMAPRSGVHLQLANAASLVIVAGAAAALVLGPALHAWLTWLGRLRTVRALDRR